MANATIYKSSSFPQVPGARLEVLCNIAGPASYTVITTGSPPTGGQPVASRDLGLVSVSEFLCMISDDGQYTGRAVFNNQPSLTTPKGATTFLLQWVVAATGAEVGAGVNLSARTLRCFAHGTY